MVEDIQTEVVVLGGGPGGYSSAYRLADLGKKVVLVEKHANLGGVCLNVGCIPSKALLHVAEVITEASTSGNIGITHQSTEIDLGKIRAFKQKTVNKLVGGVNGMAKMRNISVIKGLGSFTASNRLSVTTDSGDINIHFDQCIIAAGSSPVKLPFIPHDDPRVWDSTTALNLPYIPKRLLIIGGGIIGLEMATVYEALGSEITIVEFSSQLVPAADEDLVSVYQRYNKDRFQIKLNSKVISVDSGDDYLSVGIQNAQGEISEEQFDALLVAVGRRPNGHMIGADNAGVLVDEAGFIPANKQCKTNVPNIYAIGDIIGDPMLAHKASHEGHIAAEVIAGHKVAFEPRAIPSIAYTNPEIAWTGLTEKEAKEKFTNVSVAVYPWTASGRALGAHRSEGKTKLIYNSESGLLLGAGIVGKNAGELLGEISLALEFGAVMEDLALTIHAHPTLHETVGLAAELGCGTITDLPNPKAKLKI